MFASLSLRSLLSVGVLALALRGEGREVAGVKLPEGVEVDGKTLHLNGMALTKFLFFDISVSALYLEQPSSNGNAILSSDQVKRILIVTRRQVGRKDLIKGLKGDFIRNNPPEMMPKFKDRLDTFLSLVPDVQRGTQFTITYFPEKGTEVRLPGRPPTLIPGKDFGSALIAIWVGPNPGNPDFKRRILGGL